MTLTHCVVLEPIIRKSRNFRCLNSEKAVMRCSVVIIVCRHIFHRIFLCVSPSQQPQRLHQHLCLIGDCLFVIRIYFKPKIIVKSAIRRLKQVYTLLMINLHRTVAHSLRPYQFFTGCSSFSICDFHPDIFANPQIRNSQGPIVGSHVDGCPLAIAFSIYASRHGKSRFAVGYINSD